MVLNNCYGFLKYILVFVNLVFWAIGLATVVLAIWMLVDYTFMVSLTQNQQDFYYGLYILLAAGALMLFVSFLGCCGAIRESQCLLVCFFSCLLIVMVAQIAAGVWLYTNGDGLRQLVKSTTMTTIKEEYGVVKSRTDIVNVMQSNLKCCGANHPSDWALSKYNIPRSKDQSALLSLAVSHEKNNFKVPESCCKVEDSEDCKRSRELVVGADIPHAIFDEGCTEKILLTLEELGHTFIYVIIGFCGIELLGLLLALIICCAKGSDDGYKS